MIRRDYILRMVQEFLELLSRVSALKKGELWREAGASVDEEFQRLVGMGAQAVARLTETELLARLLQGEPTQIVRQKAFMLSTLLKEGGDVATGQGNAAEARACYLKGLHVLLETLGQGDVSEFPEFVPRVEVFVATLADEPLPLVTQALLMQHYERTTEFAKAEDALFAMLESEPDHPGLVELGIAFYQRLLTKRDADLVLGNLPRPEVEAGLKQLREKIKARETKH